MDFFPFSFFDEVWEDFEFLWKGRHKRQRQIIIVTFYNVPCLPSMWSKLSLLHTITAEDSPTSFSSIFRICHVDHHFFNMIIFRHDKSNMQSISDDLSKEIHLLTYNRLGWLDGQSKALLHPSREISSNDNSDWIHIFQ